MRKLVILLIMASTSIAGCARDSGVILARDSKSLFDDAVCSFETKTLAEDTSGSEQYRVYQQGATGFVPPSAVREEVYQQALRYCENTGKSLKILKETAPPYQYGCYPKAELTFVCLLKSNSPVSEDLLYTKLTNLKKLLDNGTITKEEFEQQKEKIFKQ